MPGITTPPTQINRNSQLVGYEFLGYSPPVAGSQPSAAAADHVHQVGKTSARAVGFGLMQYLNGQNNAPIGLVTGLNELPALSVYTIEAFLSTNFAKPGEYAVDWGVFVAQSGQTFPTPSGGASLGIKATAVASAPSWVLPDGTSILFSHSVTGSMVHLALSCDGTYLRGFIDGTLDIEVAAQALPANAIFGMWVGLNPPAGAPNNSNAFDEMRVSTVARYTASFTAPTEPFSPDPQTWGLWHLDDTALGTWFGAEEGGSNLGSNPYPLAVVQSGANYGYSGASSDSSGNGHDLWLTDNVAGGIIGAGPPINTIAGQISEVSADSGIADFTGGVIALNGQSGALWITNPAGVPFPVVSVSGQPAQIQLSGGGGPGDPWSWLVSPVT